MVVALMLPYPGLGQQDDAAYCVTLAQLALRYLGKQQAGENKPDLDTRMAIEQCQEGNTVAGIATLEGKLLRNGFSLPKR
jgi:hypothetical protein